VKEVLCLVVLALDGQPLPTAPLALPRYDVVVTLDLPAARFEVNAVVVLPPESKPRASVSFALSELFPEPSVQLAIGRVSEDSIRVEKSNRPYSRAGWGTNTWRVVPRRPIPAGEPVVLRVSYKGSGDLKSFVFSLGKQVAFAAGQNSAWYPQIEEAQAHPTGRLRGLRATGDLTFVVDRSVLVYTAARLIETKSDGRRKTLRYRIAKPIYLSFAAGPFIEAGGTYYLKARATARSDGARAKRVLRVLEHEFGPDPFEQFAIVEVPTSDADRAGFAGASADGFIMATSEFLDKPFNTAYYGHEISHQWWGAAVRPTGSRGVWMLSEAMAQFGSLRAVEVIDGPTAAERYRRDEYPGYLGQGGKSYFSLAAAGHDAALVDLPIDGEWSRPLANSKGFMAWNALSLEVGRADFRRILSSIVARYSTSRISWEDFLKEMNIGAKRDLSWFYAQWFDRAGAPDWRVTMAGPDEAPSAVVSQDSVPYRMKARVDVVSERCNSATTHVVLRAEPTNVLPLPANCGRTSVVIDPTYEIIHWTPQLRRELGRAVVR
jgi:aminopeptidase N